MDNYTPFDRLLIAIQKIPGALMIVPLPPSREPAITSLRFELNAVVSPTIASAVIKSLHSVADGKCQSGPTAVHGSMPLVALAVVPCQLSASVPVPHQSAGFAPIKKYALPVPNAEGSVDVNVEVLAVLLVRMPCPSVHRPHW